MSVTTSVAAYRFIIQFSNQDYNLRIQAHNTDPTLLVVKSQHPEAVDALAQVAGMDVGVKKTLKGSVFFITFVDKVKICAAMAKFLGEIKDQKALPPPAVDPEAAEYEATVEDDPTGVQ